MDLLNHFELSQLQWLALGMSGMLVGMSKVGVPGVSLVVVPLLAFIFGGKQSTGILLPILIMADLFSVSYYKRHAEWKYLFRIFPWSFLGIGVALWVGQMVNDARFKDLMAVMVFVCIGILFWNDRRKGVKSFPDQWWFAPAMGMLGGFATMIGNVAGPIFAIYLLVMHLPKNNYIGTQAWFFCITNLVKFPLHVFVWETITWPSLAIDLVTLPAVAIGAFAGIRIVKLIPDRTYRLFIMIVTALSAFLLLI